MIIQRHISSGKIFETLTGFILLAVAIGMRLAPDAIRDDSGGAYIMIACLLIIGSWLLINGLFNVKGSNNDMGQENAKN